MIEKRILPKFANEAAEAQWWFEHADELADDFTAAAAENRLGKGTTARRAGLATVVEIEPTDIALARELAEKRGLEYQAYIKQLLHEALTQEAEAS
jgi:hypothetical protein